MASTLASKSPVRQSQNNAQGQARQARARATVVALAQQRQRESQDQLSRRTAAGVLLSSAMLLTSRGPALAEDRYAAAEKAKAGQSAASEPGNPGQNVAAEAKSNTYSEAREDVPSIRPPGLRDTLTGKAVPEKEATGSGPKTSSKY